MRSCGRRVLPFKADSRAGDYQLGKLTIKKGLKKGTYRLSVRVTDSGGLSYKKAVKSVKVTVRVR